LHPGEAMGYWSHLLRVEIAAIVSLLVYAAALTAVLALGSGAFSSEPQSSGEALRSFGLVLWFSILPTTFVFAPVYAFLHVRGATNVAAAIVIGILSSAVLVFLFRNGAMALYALPSGAFVGAGTYLILKWSSKGNRHGIVRHDRG